MNKSSCKIMEKSAMKTEEATMNDQINVLSWEFSPEALRKALKQKGMSNMECAKRIDVTPSTVRNWLNGLRNPSVKNLNSLIAMLRLEPVMKFSPNKLNNLLIRRHLTLEGLSMMTGIEYHTLYLWSQGRTNPSIQSVKQLCNVLCINKDDIFEKEDENVKRLVFDPKKCRKLILNHFKTIKEAAKYCGIGYETLSGWCRGIETPKINNLEKLTSVLNIPIESVFTERKIMKRKKFKVSHPLKEFRKRYDLTQTDLAEILSLNQEMISSIERGRRKKPLTHEQIDRLCQVYHCSTKDLLGENEWNEGENQNERNR